MDGTFTRLFMTKKSVIMMSNSKIQVTYEAHRRTQVQAQHGKSQCTETASGLDKSRGVRPSTNRTVETSLTRKQSPLSNIKERNLVTSCTLSCLRHIYGLLQGTHCEIDGFIGLDRAIREFLLLHRSQWLDKGQETRVLTQGRPRSSA